MRSSLFVVVLLFISVRADWWDSFTETVSGGLNSAAEWVKETASPAIRDKFNDAKATLQDPETHKTIREWITEKAEKASEFAQREVIPELKKIYDAATADESKTSKDKDREIILEN